VYRMCLHSTTYHVHTCTSQLHSMGAVRS
jgi:hypothetical protein